MRNFEFYNPTKIYFGDNSLEFLKGELESVGKKVLLTYGSGSIKKSGLYNEVISILESADKQVYEVSDIMPNPRVEKVQEGIDICRRENIEFILAVGGGSVIDCSKIIAAGTKLKPHEDFWEKLIMRRENITEALKLGVVLTMPATGSEMNNGGVISNWQLNKKRSYGHDLLFPKFSILNPKYTFTLPKNQMAYGMADAFSHILEEYFSSPDVSNVSDNIAEAVMKSIVENTPIALENPHDYNARANMMWSSTMGLNGIISLGKEGDWMTHKIEHTLSAYYDIPHGAGLAIVHPMYLKYIYKNVNELAKKKYVRFAKNIWGISEEGKTDDEIAMEGIEALRNFFKSIGCPITLKEVNIDESSIDTLANNTDLIQTSYGKLSTADVKNILLMCR